MVKLNTAVGFTFKKIFNKLKKSFRSVNGLKPLLSISSLRKTEFFNIDYVQNLIKDNEAGKVKASYKLWNLICFQSWFFEWN